MPDHNHNHAHDSQWGDLRDPTFRRQRRVQASRHRRRDADTAKWKGSRLVREEGDALGRVAQAEARRVNKNRWGNPWDEDEGDIPFARTWDGFRHQGGQMFSGEDIDW